MEMELRNQAVKEQLSPFVWIGAFSCFLVCLGDFAITFFLGFLYPGYDFLNQSESYLGSSNSPVALYMTIWGVCFSLLFIAFAYGLKKSIFHEGRWQTIAIWSIVVYGLGEGLGSGLFPYDHIGDELSFSGQLHSLFSGIGEAGLILLPFVIMKIFPKDLFPRLNRFALFVGCSGIAFTIIFLLAKPISLPYRGLWQRIYLLDYYSLLVVLAMDMLMRWYRLRKLIHAAAGIPVATPSQGSI